MRAKAGTRMSKNVMSIVVGQGANFLLQALYFVVLARVLGATEYGVFSGVFALVNALTPYTTLGSGLLFLRYVSLDRTQAKVYWGNALLTAFVLSLVMAGLLLFLGPILTGTKAPMLFVVLSIANGFMFQVAAMAGQVFQTYEQMKTMATLGFLTNFCRFVAVVALFFTIHKANAWVWGLAVLGASTAAAILAAWRVHLKIGAPRFDVGLIWRHAGEGFGFSFAGTTQAVYNDIDKTMLSKYGYTTENGFYSLAYRIVEFATTPIVALDVALLPGYFQMKPGDLVQVMKRMMRSLRIGILAGVAVALATMLFAPLVKSMAGPSFQGAIFVLRWICWLPMLRAVHRMTGIALTGSGNQKLRTMAQCAVAIFNVGLNLLWIPHYGWHGAAWSSLASDGLLGVLNFLLLWYVSRKAGAQLDLLPALVLDAETELPSD